VSELTPTEGARYLLELERVDGDSAHYRVAIYTPDATYEGRALLHASGSVDMTIQAPVELAELLATFAKLTARAPHPPWPARVLRWRGPR